MENAIFAVVGAAILVWLITAFREKGAGGITYVQALKFTLLKFVFGIRHSGFDPKAEWKGPVVFIVLAQSSLDRAILKPFLPAQTFHVETEGEDATAQAMTLFKSVMAGHGITCVYLPPQVEASPETMGLLAEIGAVAREASARIVPIFIRGTRFSLFSHWKQAQAPRSLLPQVVMAAAPEFQLSGTSGQHLADQLLDGAANAKFRSVNLRQSLFEALVAAAKLYGPSREILEDALGARLSYRKLLIGVRVLAKRIEAMSKRGEAIGILLPNSTGVVVGMFAVASAGRVAAMLNYTAGPAAIVSALGTGNISTVLTSKGFIEKADLGGLIEKMKESGAKIVHVEELRESIGFMEKFRAFLLWRRAVAKSKPDDPAIVLFTSGSEGTPKGVVLSANSLVANAAQVDCRIDFSSEDTLFNVLPLFHSFGLLGGAFLPIYYGVRLFLYPSPLHYKLIPSLARKVAPTFMFGTDTFLNGYARAAKDGDFDSLRMIVAGAEAVKPETRKMYRDRFDALVVEGYGMTEASPVVAVNSATFSKDGSVGRLLTGMEMRIEPVEGIAEGGRLFIAGPNLMLGYLLGDKPGVVQPLASKWHDTGDIVSIDERGFISIKGRAKRFAKIAGEMISLGAVEMMVKQLWPEANHAAISLPDKRRGERIVLVTTQLPARKDELIAYSKRFGATEMMIPDDIVNVPEIPVLGSGKVDYTATTALVAGTVVV
ncbi:AMP-binding protein [Rhizobium sp. TH2]|uniref:AMP-binding protein n=1 Tax=Rhizobium sp. TH2 TaxID=2775403 RepID=UPI0021585DD4|nr:AMP-binding protein [Rhizobium sp. TH2]UVC10608.1 AMP-binding protein [Rhizobium sp. TH2]